MSICNSLPKTSSKNSEINTCSFSHPESVNQDSKTLIFEQIQVPNIEHELNVAISLIQQGSLTTGDNLFDHLADIIKLVLKEQPENIVDYFEELSLNVREQKFRMPENFPWTYFKPIDVLRAKSLMKLMNIPNQPNDNEYDVCKENPPRIVKNSSKITQNSIQPIVSLQRKLALNENVQRLHLYWSLCGFNLSNDEVSQLSYALQKVQYHQIVQHARFWGIIFGLKKSYYIVEAQLTQSEIDNRFEKMREEVMENIRLFQDRKSQIVNKEYDIDLIPGAQWQNHSMNELEKMKNLCKTSVPDLKNNPNFDIPPEPIGTGLNRRTYFVVNSLNDDWIELPIVSPQQIQISRKIKKFLKGELDADVHSYPSFPGTDKHYLRAIIARITSGTYVAPNDYYRKLTKTEILEVYGENAKETDIGIDESDVEDEGEEEELDNDALIVENENYKPCPEKLTTSKSWVHVRPNILGQGRIAYFDDKKALEALENGSYLNVRSEEEIEETDIEDEVDPHTNEESIGPGLFNTCFEDKNEENVKSWSIRHSSTHNKINQLTILRSNLWPGAYSFTFEKYCDSIYFGSGSKYTARNMSIVQIPPIEFEYLTSEVLSEVPDPTVEMEQAWRLFHEKKTIEEIGEEEIEEEENSC